MGKAVISEESNDPNSVLNAKMKADYQPEYVDHAHYHSPAPNFSG
jgi:hypothetical protein